jgi:Ni/Fe-hydrogenase subunit HybB-like protein
MMTTNTKNRNLTFVYLILVALIAVGLGIGIVRLIHGMGATTNLNDTFPWDVDYL